MCTRRLLAAGPEAPPSSAPRAHHCLLQPPSGSPAACQDPRASGRARKGGRGERDKDKEPGGSRSCSSPVLQGPGRLQGLGKQWHKHPHTPSQLSSCPLPSGGASLGSVPRPEAPQLAGKEAPLALGWKERAGPQAARVGVRGPSSPQAQPWAQLAAGGGDTAFPQQSCPPEADPRPSALSLSLSQPHSFLGTAAGQPLPGELEQQQQPWGQERLPASKFSPGRLASPPFALGNNEPAPAHLPAAEGHPRPAAPPHWGQMSPPGQQTRPGRALPGGRGRRQPGPPARGALRMPCGSCPLDGGEGGSSCPCTPVRPLPRQAAPS